MNWRKTTVCVFCAVAWATQALAGPRGAGEAADPVQAVALEAARQDMVQAQLAELVGRFGDLLQDLASNQNIGADLTKMASGLRDRLLAVRQVRLAHARKLIDEAIRKVGPAGPRLAEAQRQIELAARELGSLLLQAGISQACEVFAMELRQIIGRQESLLANGAGPWADAAARRHAQMELSVRAAALLDEIRSMHDAPTDALAAVRLARARKIIEAADVVAEMRQASADAATQPSRVADRQGKALRGLRQGLLKLRPDARLEEIVRARGLLGDMAAAHREWRAGLAALSAEQLLAQKTTLRLKLEAILRPLQQLGDALEIGAAVAGAQQAAQEAAAAMETVDRSALAAAQERIESSLAAATLKLAEQIARLNALGDTHKRMMEAADRLKLLAELRDRSEQIKNVAYEAAMGGKDLKGAAAAQEQLAQDAGALAANLPASSSFASAIRRPLRKASQAMQKSAAPLRAGQLDAAVPELTKSEQALKEATDIAKRELGVLEKLWLFRQASADIRQIRQNLDDVEAEQADLRGDVAAAQSQRRTVLDLTAPQAMLVRATQQLQESASAIREASLMREPLDAAISAMNKAASLLEKDQAQAALESQKQAGASLHDARKVATGLINQIDLIVVEIDAASELSSRAMDLLQRQIVLRETTEDSPDAELGRLAGEQDILLAETQVMTTLTVAPKAASGFTTAANEMTGAIGRLKATSRPAAVEHQKRAEEALRAAILALDEYILSMMQLLGSSSAIIQEYITAFDGITAILFLATEQRELREICVRTPDVVLPTHAPRQTEFRERAKVIAQMPNALTGQGRLTGWEHVEAAAKFMDQAVGTLNAKVKDKTIEHQQLAEKELRIAFAMNVVELIMALQPPPPPGNGATANIPLLRDRPALISLDHWFEFSKATPSGKLPLGNKSEWNSLVDRERAALNENFARELPLEYRKLLKDYYEALAK